MFTTKYRHFVAASRNLAKLFVFAVFALLVCYAAACFASGLAGSLAFAATAVLSAFAKVTRFESLYSFHLSFLLIDLI